MKIKTYAACFLLFAMFLPSLGQAKFKFGADWIQEPSTGLSAYAAPVVSYSDAGLRKIVKGKEDEAVYLERGKVVLDAVGKTVDDRLPKIGWKKGGKPLTVEVVLGNLFTGNGAARFFSGMPGNYQLNVILKSDKKVVGELEMVLPIGKSVGKSAKNGGAYIVKYLKKKM